MKPERSIEKLTNGTSLRIVAIGDSLTQGWMVRKGYIAFLEEMIREKYQGSKFQFINKGIPGDTADGGLFRIREDVLDLDPDLVLIQFALNDAFIGVTPERFRNQMQAMISHVRSDTEAEIVLLTSVCLGNTKENEMAQDYYRVIEELGGENSIPVARVHDYWRRKIGEGAEFRKLVQFDQVHPTLEGHLLMAEAVMELF